MCVRVVVVAVVVCLFIYCGLLFAFTERTKFNISLSCVFPIDMSAAERNDDGQVIRELMVAL